MMIISEEYKLVFKGDSSFLQANKIYNNDQIGKC